MKISNITVIKEQLSYAVKAVFENQPISITATLVFSAYGILVDLLKNKDSFRDWMHLDHSENTPDLWKKWNAHWGFFKHARRGLEQFDFSEAFEESLLTILFTAIHDFQILEDRLLIGSPERSSSEMEIYQLWYYARDIKLFTDEKTESIKVESRKLFPQLHMLSLNDQKSKGKEIIENIVNGELQLM